VNDSQGGVFNYRYDAAGALLTQAEPTGTVDYILDALERVSLRQVTGQNSVSYIYDGAGNLTSAGPPFFGDLGNLLPAGTTFGYDARNLIAEEARVSGEISAYTRDPLGRVLSIVDSFNQTILNTQTYSYDADGNRVGGSPGISQPLITPAAAATVDAANELLTNGQTVYTSDANGNRLTESGPNGSYNYAWDGRNRLSSITDGSGNRTSFKYDFARNLIEVDRTGSGIARQQFVYDQWTNVVSLTDASGLPVTMITGTWVDSHLVAVDSTNSTFRMTDPLNSTIATTDIYANLSAKRDYEPYGQMTGSGPVDFPFSYTGRVPIVGNVVYYRNRFYDSGTGRFLSEDPLGFGGGGPNLFTYADGRPTSSSDPTGLDALGSCANPLPGTYGPPWGPCLGPFYPPPFPPGFIGPPTPPYYPTVWQCPPNPNNGLNEYLCNSNNPIPAHKRPGSVSVCTSIRG
jgi:RHS repeat-associated protein